MTNSVVSLKHSVDSHQLLQLQHESLCEVWEKSLEACSLLSVPISVQVPLEAQEPVGCSVCRTLVLVAPLDLSSQRQFSQVLDDCLDHLSLKDVLVK